MITDIFAQTIELMQTVIRGGIKGMVFGMLGYVFITYLIQSDSIFSSYRSIIQTALFKKDFSRVNDFTKKLDFVLTTCAKCFAGQLSLWYCVLFFDGFFGLLMTICIAILTAKRLVDIGV